MDREKAGAVGTAICPECGQTLRLEASCDWCYAVLQCAWAPALTTPIWSDAGFDEVGTGGSGSALRLTGSDEALASRCAAQLIDPEDLKTWHDNRVGTDVIRA